MKETLIEVLMDIFNQILQEEALSSHDTHRLLQTLEAAQKDVDMIPPEAHTLSPDQKLLISQSFQSTAHSPAMRILTEEEKAKLGTEGWSYILSLEAAETILPWIRELILHEVITHENESIDLDELKVIIFQLMQKIITKDEHIELIEHLLFYSDQPTSLH